MKGGQYAKFTLGHWYYPLDFVGSGLFHRFSGRSNPLDFTCDWNHLVDYLAGAASEIQALAPYLNIRRLKQKHWVWMQTQ
jgi:hypothetical protein